MKKSQSDSLKKLGEVNDEPPEVESPTPKEIPDQDN